MGVQPVEPGLSERLTPDAYIREIRSPGLRSTFIRLTRRGGPTPAHTIDAECTVDLDGDGNVIGVTVHDYNDTKGKEW